MNDTHTLVEPSLPLAAERRRRQRNARRSAVRWTKRVVLAVTGLAAVVAIGWAFVPKPLAVDVATARRGTLQVFVEQEGRARVRERFVVAAPISGNLLRIGLEAGDPVLARMVLAELLPPDPALLDARTEREAQARLAAGQAHVRQSASVAARARAAHDLAAREATRARTLVERGAIPSGERDRAETNARVAAAELAAALVDRQVASAEVEAARAALGLGRPGERPAPLGVPAPAAGRVLRVLRESEGPVAAGTPLLEVGDPSSLEVVIDVLSSDAARIRVGAPASIEEWGGEPLRGRVRRIEPSAFTRLSALGVEEQRINVLVSLEHTPANLLDGARVEAKILAWQGDGVLLVPASAVLRHGDGWAVYAITAGRAHLQPVVIGHRGRLDVQVERGLGVGARVVLYPGDRVTEGARVTRR